MSDFDADPTTEPLVRALQAPGTAAELADQQAYLEMFRQEHPSIVGSVQGAAPVAISLAARSRNAVRRLGVGSAVAVALAVGGSGVAAAYAGALPDPIQRITHRVLAPVGVPPAPAPKPDRREEAKAATSPSATPSAEPSATRSARPRPSPSSVPTRRPGQPSRSSSTPSATPSRPSAAATSDAPDAVGSPSPEAQVSPSPSDLPSAGPSAEPSATLSPSAGLSPGPVVGLRPRAITTTVDADRVQAGVRVVLTATVDAGVGSPVARATVVLERRTDSRWREVTTRTTDDDGTASIVSSPVLRTTDFRITASGVDGAVVRVVPAPVLSLDRTLADRRTLSVTVTTYGAQRGDLVRLIRQRDDGDVDVDQARVNRFGEARFDIGLRGQPKTYRAVVSRTARHAASAIEVDVPARGGS